jgi:hypothetical protein
LPSLPAQTALASRTRGGVKVIVGIVGCGVRRDYIVQRAFDYGG